MKLMRSLLKSILKKVFGTAYWPIIQRIKLLQSRMSGSYFGKQGLDKNLKKYVDYDCLNKMKYMFIVGCGHSGTSLMLSIWNCTESVYALKDETLLLENYSIEYFKSKVLGSVDFQKISWIVEKTPRHLYQLGKICNDDESYGLIMVRNPLDTVASLVKRGLPLNKAIKRYEEDNYFCLKYEKKNNISIVRYEDLVSNHSKVLSELSLKYGIDLIDGNKIRENDNTLYFSNAGATRAQKTDGQGKENHLALRNFQMRQPIKDMNGLWRNRISEQDYEKITKRLKFFFNYFNFKIPDY